MADKKSDISDSFLTVIGAIAVSIVVVVFFIFILGIVLIPSLLMHGYVATYLWEWFIMPVFGVSAISVIQAIGLIITIRFGFAGSFQKDSWHNLDKKDQQEMLIKALVQLYGLPWVVLGIGYVLKSLV